MGPPLPISATSKVSVPIRSAGGATMALSKSSESTGGRSQCSARYSQESRDGKLYAKRIHLGRAHLAGKVESVSGNVITIRTRDGKDVRLTVNSSTKYFEIIAKGKRQAGSLKDVHAGMRLLAAGSYDASHNFDAALVAYRNK